MLVIVAPVLIFSGIYIAIGAYFLLSYCWIPHLRSRHVMWFIVSCFLYAVYNLTRLGMYTAPTAAGLYFWLRMAHALIALIAISIAGFLSHYVKNEQQWIMKYFYAIFGMFALAVLFGGKHVFVVYDSIAGSIGIFNASIPRLRGDAGAVVIALYAFLFLSIFYYFLHIAVWGVKGEKKEIIAMMSGMVVLFAALTFDVVMAFKPMTFIFLGEFGFFFLMLAMCYSTINQIALHWKERSQRGQKGQSGDWLKEVDIASLKERLLNLMHEEKVFRDENISLEVMAKYLSLSTSKFSQFMNAVMESDFRNFINKFRIEEAKRLLETQPDLSIKHICYEVGFQSSSTFHDAFKKFTGTSPARFRKDLAA
ncbi:MAG: helix-turn-helix domain-containing protein [Desulfobacteraceae bacterium]|nr:helix-turn-helix domain-containing protein [Desulfobacteraceae bacterium]